MSKKFSFNKLLRNDKLMLIFSVVFAIIIWALVIYGPSVTEEKTITVPITVRLNTSAEMGANMPGQHFQVLSKTEDTVEVVVKGNRSVLSKLKAEDIVVSADLSSLLLAVDDYPVTLSASKNPASDINDYTIEDMKIRQIKVSCDYIGETSFVVEKDISAVEVTDSTKYQLGKPTLDTQLLSEEKITISGPKKVRDRIKKVVAKVDATEKISIPTVFDAKLVAYDADDRQVDLSQCTFVELSDQADPSIARVTVPVNYFATATLSVAPQNLPASLVGQYGFIQLAPEKLDLLGQEDEVLKLVEELKKLPLNFDNVSLKSKRVSIPLSIPSHVTISENITSVTATVNMDGLSTKTLSVPLVREDEKSLAANVTIQNIPKNATADLSTKALSVTVVGEKADVDALKASELKVVIDASAQSARITLPSHRTAWVYYGEDSADGLSVIVTIKTS